MIRLKNSNNNVKLFVISIFIFCLSGILKVIAWVYGFDLIAEFWRWVSIAFGIFVIYLVLNLFFKNKKLPMIKKIFAFLLVVLLVCFSGLFLIGNRFEWYSSSVTNIESKEQEGKSYSISVYNSNLKKTIEVMCDKKVYDSVIVDKQVLYAIEYRTIVYLNYYSRILSISDDYADNRDKNIK
nr:hypothetical protein [Sedimentibacter sp.]